MQEEYFDFSTWEGAEMVKAMFTFLPDNDEIRNGFLETFAMILLTV